MSCGKGVGGNVGGKGYVRENRHCSPIQLFNDPAIGGVMREI